MQLEQAKEAKENKEKGKEFIAEKAKDPAVKTTQSGLAYKVLNEGSGDNVKIGDHVKIKYTGKPSTEKCLIVLSKINQKVSTSFARRSPYPWMGRRFTTYESRF